MGRHTFGNTDVTNYSSLTHVPMLLQALDTGEVHTVRHHARPRSIYDYRVMLAVTSALGAFFFAFTLALLAGHHSFDAPVQSTIVQPMNSPTPSPSVMESPRVGK
jgi:hypothetical protein